MGRRKMSRGAGRFQRRKSQAAMNHAGEIALSYAQVLGPCGEEFLRRLPKRPTIGEIRRTFVAMKLQGRPKDKK